MRSPHRCPRWLRRGLPLFHGWRRLKRRRRAPTQPLFPKRPRRTVHQALAGQRQAELDLKEAREALARLAEPRSVTPLADRLGIAPWAWDLILAGLRSLGILGGSLAIGLVPHPRRPAILDAPKEDDPPRKLRAGRPRLIDNSTSIEILPLRPRNKREHVSLFLREVLKPDPSAQASLRSLHARYNDWCGDEKLPPAELGKELRAIINALGLKCEQSGRDVVVYGAVINDQRTQ